MYQETKRIIKNAVLENKLVVFVGAGASVNSGVPLWDAAVNKIKEKLEPEFKAQNDYLKIPQFYYISRGYKEYNELMKEIFRFEEKMPNAIHDRIFKMKPAHIISTNYDDFLEKTADKNGEFLEIIERDTDIPYVKNERLLIKMHGGFRYDNYVLKEDDYLNYSENFKLTETLIKSIIARYTVLFIGYSFNDPDTKQIFNWTKNALGVDFQRAYMVVAHQPSSQILNDYYRNLGINLIFAEKCMSDEQGKKYDSKNYVFERTLLCLDYLLAEDSNSDIAQLLTTKLTQYAQLNYVLSRYIQRAITWNHGHIIGNSLILNSNEYYELFSKVVSKEDKSLSVIYDIISKSSLKSFQKKVESDEKKDKIEIVKEIGNEIDNKYFQALYSADFGHLKSFADSINVFDSSVLLNHKFMAAFAYYKLNHLEKALKTFRELSQYCKIHKLYVWHFIAEYNIKNIKKQHYLSNQDDQISTANLQEILFKYNLQTDENNFLLEISNFNLFYYAYYEVCQMSKKSAVESTSTELQEIYKLEYYCLDLYYFLTKNFLVIEKFTEIRKLFQEFVFAAFRSHISTTKERDLFGQIKVVNFALPEISKSVVMFCIDCFNYKDLQTFFSLNCTKGIKLSDDAENYLILRTINYIKSFELKTLDRFNDYNILNLIALIASKTIFQCDKFNTLVEKFSSILEKGCFRNDFIRLFSNYIAEHYNSNKKIIDKKQLVRVLAVLININETNEHNVVYNYYNLNDMLRNISFILHEMDAQFVLEEKDCLKLFNAKGSLQLSYFYKLCNEERKVTIMSKVSDLLLQSKSFDFNLYWAALVNEIIEPKLEIEQLLKKELDLEYSNDGIKIYPDPYTESKQQVINLKQNGYLLEPDKFIEYFISSNDEEKFLFDPENFDYSAFKIFWLSSYNNGLLETISKQQNVKSNIANCFRMQYQQVGLEEKEIEIYFKYFT